jgi:hypothetical protein
MVQPKRRHYSHDVDAAQEAFQRHQQTCETIQKLVIELASLLHPSLMEQCNDTRYVYLY